MVNPCRKVYSEAGNMAMARPGSSNGRSVVVDLAYALGWSSGRSLAPLVKTRDFGMTP